MYFPSNFVWNYWHPNQVKITSIIFTRIIILSSFSICSFSYFWYIIYLHLVDISSHPTFLMAHHYHSTPIIYRQPSTFKKWRALGKGPISGFLPLKMQTCCTAWHGDLSSHFQYGASNAARRAQSTSESHLLCCSECSPSFFHLSQLKNQVMGFGHTNSRTYCAPLTTITLAKLQFLIRLAFYLIFRS